MPASISDSPNDSAEVARSRDSSPAVNSRYGTVKAATHVCDDTPGSGAERLAHSTPAPAICPARSSHPPRGHAAPCMPRTAASSPTTTPTRPTAGMSNPYWTSSPTAPISRTARQPWRVTGGHPPERLAGTGTQPTVPSDRGQALVTANGAGPYNRPAIVQKQARMHVHHDNFPFRRGDAPTGRRVDIDGN